MFYYLTLNKTIDIQPRYFGPRLREVIMEKLIAEVSRAQRALGRGTRGAGWGGGQVCLFTSCVGDRCWPLPPAEYKDTACEPALFQKHGT